MYGLQNSDQNTISQTLVSLPVYAMFMLYIKCAFVSDLDVLFEIASRSFVSVAFGHVHAVNYALTRRP